jgi:CPA2 family monovalent cation:H+ antiporter-2
MVAEILPLTTIGVIILIAIGISILVKKLDQNEVIGFILAGFLLGPVWLNFLSPEDALVTGFAELGLFVLLFYLGIELSLRDFLDAGSTIFGLAIIDLLLTTGLGTLIMLMLGYSTIFSLVIGLMLFSTSTAIVAKFILGKNLLKNSAAKISLSILILQDFLGIVLLVFITSMSKPGGSALQLGLVAVVFAVGAFYAVHHLSKGVEQWMKRNGFGHTEVTLYALGVGLIVAMLASILGLSTAIGAYFAGFALSETASGKRIKKDVGFLRDFFLLFFFVAFGTTLFFDPTLHQVMLPSLDQFSFILTVALGLGIAALVAHSFSTRIFGGWFGLSSEDSTLSAILLFPLGEFVVIIATVAVAAFTGPEAALLRPLAFLIILVTVFFFQPLYKFRALHQKIMSFIPRIPTPPKKTAIKQHTPYTIRQAKKMAYDLFIVLCLAALTVILFNELPGFGVPIMYSREATAILVFAFFAAAPLFGAARSFKRILKSIKAA